MAGENNQSLPGIAEAHPIPASWHFWGEGGTRSCPPNCHLTEAVKDQQKSRGGEKGQGRESVREELGEGGRGEGPVLCVQVSGVGVSILRSVQASWGQCGRPRVGVS